MPLISTMHGQPFLIPLTNIRADSRFAPSQRETALLCNGVTHWLDQDMEPTLNITLNDYDRFRCSIHGSFWVRVQPIRVDVTLSRRLSLVEPLSWMISNISHIRTRQFLLYIFLLYYNIYIQKSWCIRNASICRSVIVIYMLFVVCHLCLTELFFNNIHCTNIRRYIFTYYEAL